MSKLSRIPSLRHFLRRGLADPRCFTYDLLEAAATPASRDRLARAAAWLRPKTPGFTASPEARAWHRALSTDGITPLLPALPAAMIAEIRQYFEVTPCIDPYRRHLGRFLAAAPPSTESNMGYFELPDILAAPHVLGLLNDPRVLETAELYLGCKPLLDNLGCWWSFGDRPAAKGTQRYHRDFDSLRGFKLFIYLTDVDAVSGPHVFMKGSHRSEKLPTGAAQSDAAVRDAFGAEHETTMLGPAGSWFLADTFGFHKGQLPTSGRRLLISAQYNVNASPHMPRRPVTRSASGRFDPDVNRLIAFGV